MFGTITVGSCVSVQGEVVQRLADGRITLRIGDQYVTGKPANPGPSLSMVRATSLPRVVQPAG